VSVFILTQLHFGYYIHGRSVYGNADTDMHNMNIMLKKEEVRRCFTCVEKCSAISRRSRAA